MYRSTTQELSANRKDLQAPTLVRPIQSYQGSGPPSCTTPQQPTIYYIMQFLTFLDPYPSPTWPKSYEHSYNPCLLYNELVK